MADVFISYVEEDHAIVDAIAHAIDDGLISTWHYRRDSLPGPTYVEQVTDAIGACKIMLVLVSKGSMESNEVAKEVEFAHSNRRLFLPVLYGVSHADFQQERRNWHLMFGAAAAIQLDAKFDECLTRIVKGCRALLSPAPIPEPIPPVTVESAKPCWENFRDLMVLRHRSGSLTCAAYSPDGKYVATASDDGIVRLWNADTGTAFRTIMVPTESDYKIVSSVAFSPDGTRIATTLQDFHVWEVQTGKKLLTYTVIGPATSASFSSDGKYVVGTAMGKAVMIFDAKNGKSSKGPARCPATTMDAVFSSDAKHIAAGFEDGTAAIIDVNSRTIRTVLRGHTAEVRAVAFAPDGERIATAARDNTVRVWDCASGDVVLVLPHGNWATDAAFSPDSQHIVTASLDHTARIWNGATGDEIAVLRHESAVSSASFSPDGRRVLTSSTDGTGHIWQESIAD